jgi:ribosomal peptide maturation radical SAM protein 1
MPFGPADWPHLGLSLLKAELEKSGAICDVRYFSMDFARQIGKRFYISIAEDDPSYKTLAGEWIFTPALHGMGNVRLEDYLNQVQAQEPDFFTTELLDQIDGAQSLAEPFLEDCLDHVDWEGYDLIGFSTNTQQQIASLSLAKRVKDRWPEKKIIFGGNNVENEMGLELLRMHDYIDYVCLGEGDTLLPELAHQLYSKGEPRDIPGLAYRKNEQIISTNSKPHPHVDLDSLPFPNFDDFFRQHLAIFGEDGWRGDLPFETSRGCWWGENKQCTFCGSSRQWIRYRQKSTQRTLDEIEHLVRRYEPRTLFANDLTIPRNMNHLLSELAKSKPNLKLVCELRAGMSKPQLEQMKQVGVDFVLIGIESLSTPTLKLMSKGTSSLLNIQTLKWCRELGIKIMWSIMYGFPLEKASDYQAMADLFPLFVHLDPPSFITRINLLRFSPHFSEPEKYGFVNVRPSVFFGHVYPTASTTSLWNLARFFDFDYVDGRDPDAYIIPTQHAVDKWREVSLTSVLTYVDDGEHLRLFDTRPIGKHKVHLLTGLERELYLLCDQQRALKGLHQRYSMDLDKKDEVAKILTRMVDERIMVSENLLYLSLAVDIGRHIQPEKRADVSDQFCIALSHALMGTKPAET